MSAPKGVDMTIRIRDLTVPQAAALRLMFEQMRQLGGTGSSRWVAFYSDGDGNFRPKPEYEFSAHREETEAQEGGHWTTDGDRWEIDFDELVP